MKRQYLMLAAAAVVSVALVGCSGTLTKQVATTADHIQTLKEKGCEAVPENARQVIVKIAKANLENYPPNGICNPD